MKEGDENWCRHLELWRNSEFDRVDQLYPQALFASYEPYELMVELTLPGHLTGLPVHPVTKHGNYALIRIGITGEVRHDT